MEIQIDKVMDRNKIAVTINQILDTGVEMLQKEKLGTSDYGKLKVMRVMGSPLNAGVAMIQQETAMVRAALVSERMKQLGYGNNEPQQIQ